VHFRRAFRPRLPPRIISYILDTTAPSVSVFKSERPARDLLAWRPAPRDLGNGFTESRTCVEDYKRSRGIAGRGRWGYLYAIDSTHDLDLESTS